MAVKKAVHAITQTQTKEDTTCCHGGSPDKKAASSCTTPYTKITIKCDAGFGNTLFIRGNGIPMLSWEKGVPLKNIGADEWLFEINTSFTHAEIQILLNDTQFETGPNHALKCGTNVQYTPAF
jgi:hypothetical protein